MKKPFYRQTWFIILIVLIVIGLFISDFNEAQNRGAAGTTATVDMGGQVAELSECMYDL